MSAERLVQAISIILHEQEHILKSYISTEGGAYNCSM